MHADENPVKSMTIKEIADLAGVSPSAVSLALNQKKGVSEETRRQVKEIAQQYGYVHKKKNKRQSSFTVLVVKYFAHGMLVEENQGFISSIIDCIEQECHQRSIDVLLKMANKKIFAQVLDNILSNPPDGVIVVGTELSQEQIPLLKRIPVPLVLVDTAAMYENVNTVNMTNQDIGYIAAKHLCEYGHREIGYINSNTFLSNFQWRKIGYKEALEAYGAKQGAQFYVTPTLEGAYEDICERLRAGEEISPAFVADNDSIAIGAMRAFQAYGYDIPGDISVIGVDDIPYSALSSPPLSTIRISRTAIGELTVSLLSCRMQSPVGPPTRIQVCGELVVRESTRRVQQEE